MSFPQGFITGMLQTYARKYNVPIDTLKLDFSVMDTMLDQEIIERKHRETAKEVGFSNLCVHVSNKYINFRT